MSTQMIVAIFAGLLPVLMTSILAWLQQHGEEARRDRALNVAQRQIQFLQSYLGAHSLASAPEQLEPVRQLVAKETERIFAELTTELKEIDGSLHRSRGKNAVQKLLLLYKMHTRSGKVVRALYLFSLPIAIIMTMAVIDVTVAEQDGEIILSFLTVLLASLPFTLPSVFLRWLAVTLDNRTQA